MRYVVKQKLFSLGDRFTIKNEFENDVFVVQSKILSFGKKLRIYDLAGNELCYIEQQVFRFMPEYNIFIGEQMVANVKKKFAFFKNDFVITSPNSEYQVEGDLWAHDFRIYKEGQNIAHISKEFFTLRDTYGVEIDDRYDQVSTLALAIVIDMACHDNNN